MSCKEERRRHVARMLRDGEMGVFVSMMCLSVAYAIKRGTPLEKIGIASNRPVSAAEEAAMRDSMRASHDEMLLELKGKPEGAIDEIIALYTEHLKAAGYCVEAGTGAPS